MGAEVVMRSIAVPAQAGIHKLRRSGIWIPACAGMTENIA